LGERKGRRDGRGRKEKLKGKGRVWEGRDMGKKGEDGAGEGRNTRIFAMVCDTAQMLYLSDRLAGREYNVERGRGKGKGEIENEGVALVPVGTHASIYYC